MRFLANENFPYPSTLLLRQAGHDVICIAELFPSWKDRQVLEYAVREARIILTFDRDYGEMLFRFQLTPPPAVVYFRQKGSGPEAAGQRLSEYLRVGRELTGFFTVLDEEGVRQRHLSL
jgi:predicted nuclease of predicted toxin-antitoxin system